MPAARAARSSPSVTGQTCRLTAARRPDPETQTVFQSWTPLRLVAGARWNRHARVTHRWVRDRREASCTYTPGCSPRADARRHRCTGVGSSTIARVPPACGLSWRVTSSAYRTSTCRGCVVRVRCSGVLEGMASVGLTTDHRMPPGVLPDDAGYEDADAEAGAQKTRPTREYLRAVLSAEAAMNRATDLALLCASQRLLEVPGGHDVAAGRPRRWRPWRSISSAGARPLPPAEARRCTVIAWDALRATPLSTCRSGSAPCEDYAVPEPRWMRWARSAHRPLPSRMSPSAAGDAVAALVASPQVGERKASEPGACSGAATPGEPAPRHDV